MENCIFCKIANKEAPAHIVYEDENFVVFLDIHPQSPGHCMIIPKKHYRWVWDVPNVGDYFEVARKIAKAQMKAFETDWILSKVVGEDVYHAHIWVYPARKRLSVAMAGGPNSSIKGDPKDFESNAEKIKKELN